MTSKQFRSLKKGDIIIDINHPETRRVVVGFHDRRKMLLKTELYGKICLFGTTMCYGMSFKKFLLSVEHLPGKWVFTQ